MTDATAETKALLQYRASEGLAVITLDDPPANAYSYEMNRQLDDAILKARMDEHVHVMVLTGAGDKFFFGGREYRNAGEGGPDVQILFLPARK